MGASQRDELTRDPERAAIALVREVLVHLVRGGRMLFLLSPGGEAPRSSWTPLILLGLLSVLVPTLDALVRDGLAGQFVENALPGALFHLPVLVLAAWSLAVLAGRVERTLDLLLALLAMAFCLDGLVALSYNLAEDLWEWGGDLAYQIPTLWLGLAWAVAAIRLLGLAAGRRLAALVLALITLSLPLGNVYRDRALWEGVEDAAEQAANERRWNALVSEDNFYLQSSLLERELEGLQPGRPGAAELFFVGLAGDAGQDVFMKEVRAVEQLFRERFGTEGHSLTLINNPASVTQSPIASATSLERALERVAQAMNGEEDILFLYLSSHGGEDHRLQLDFWPLRFNPLDPRRLRAMLDRTGIQRRVVVVSACYSGGFIEALQDAHTLVITAAAPDRQSFGCSNEADFTYFGKAYFDEALRQTHSFIRAFELAKARIAERERQEGEKPSEPRLFLGEGLRQPLEDFARERAVRQDLTGPASGPEFP